MMATVYKPVMKDTVQMNGSPESNSSMLSWNEWEKENYK
jgi:hypothetical protein